MSTTLHCVWVSDTCPIPMSYPSDSVGNGIVYEHCLHVPLPCRKRKFDIIVNGFIMVRAYLNDLYGCRLHWFGIQFKGSNAVS